MNPLSKREFFMTKRYIFALLSSSFMFTSTSFANTPVTAVANPSAPVTAITNPSAPVTQGEFKELLRKTLIDNPEIFMEVVEKMQASQNEETEKKAREGIVKYKKELFDNIDTPTIGPKDADVTIIEFFDYHCGYCKQALANITKLLDSDKKVKVVFKEYPILSEDSTYASKAAIAVYRIHKDKYFAFHTALFGLSGKITEAVVVREATKLGIDTEKLKAEIKKPEIDKIIADDRELGNNIGVRGTPAIIIGDQLFPGAVPLEVMQKAIAEYRANNKK